MKHLEGLLGNLETNQHTRIFHHNPHSIILHTNHLNNGTPQVVGIGHLSTLLFNLCSSNIGHKDGEDNHTLNHNLSPHLIILILSTKQISSRFRLDLCLQFLSSHNNLITSRIKTLHDLHYYRHNRHLTQIISQLKLSIALNCKLFHPMLFRLYPYMRYNYDLEEL